MIAPEKLLALAVGDLDEREAEEVELHVLSCAACARMLERWLAIGDALRDLVRGAAVRVGATPSLVRELEAAGLVTRTYRIPRNGSVACTVDASDRYVAAYLEADLRDVRRVDVERMVATRKVRFEDVPFDAERGEVAWVESGAYLRTVPTAKMPVRLLAVDDGGERELGTYVFDHTAFRA